MSALLKAVQQLVTTDGPSSWGEFVRTAFRLRLEPVPVRRKEHRR